MRAIGSWKKVKSVSTEKSLIGDWIKEQQAEFAKCSNHRGLDLDFRCQHSQFGWPFHDRFLIFPLGKDKPRAWSLGTSINSFGKEHHILQEVQNAKLILDAFLELWAELDPEHCMVWRSN